MQVVINIEDRIYKEVKNSKSVPDISGTTIVNCIEAIKKSTPLPKGYLIEIFEDKCRVKQFKCKFDPDYIDFGNMGDE